MVVSASRDSHKVSGVIVACYGGRFELLNQDPDYVDEDDDVDLEEKYAHVCTITHIIECRHVHTEGKNKLIHQFRNGLLKFMAAISAINS